MAWRARNPVGWSWSLLAAIHVVGGLVASLGIAIALANTAPASAEPIVDGPFYDPDRLGVWIQERTPGRRSVLFMLGRSRVFEQQGDAMVPVEPRPERAAPGWATDWSRRIPEMHATGDYVDPSQAMDFGFGWPLVVLHSSQVLDTTGEALASREEGVAELGGVKLPMGVSLIGTLVGVIMLGAPLSAGVGAYWALRHTMRRRRGVCTVCAYAIDPEVPICPECGTVHGPIIDDEGAEGDRLAA